MPDLKHVQNIDGRLYFRRTWRENGKRMTRRHRLPDRGHPDFMAEYNRLLKTAGHEDMATPWVAREITTYPPRGAQGASEHDLYVIQSGDFGPVKIGRSKNVAARLRSLQTGQHERIRLLGVGVGLGHLEGDAHYAFRPIRVQNEWFQWAEPVREFVKMLNDGVELTDDIFEQLHQMSRPVKRAGSRSGR